MTKREVLLGGKVSVHKLVGEEHRQDGRDREGDVQPKLLPFVETQSSGSKEPEARRQPRPPDEELQKHHGVKLKSHGSLHGGGSLLEMSNVGGTDWRGEMMPWRSVSGKQRPHQPNGSAQFQYKVRQVRFERRPTIFKYFISLWDSAVMRRWFTQPPTSDMAAAPPR